MKTYIGMVTKLQSDIVDYVVKNFEDCKGVCVSINPPGITIPDDETKAKFYERVVWDYNTHTVFNLFLAGRVNAEKFEKVTKEVTKLMDIILERKPK